MFKPFTFQCEYTLDEERDYKVVKQSGFVYAETYADAVKRLTRYFGEKEMVSITNLVELEDSPIVVPKKVVKNVIEEEYFDEYDD